MSSGAEQVLEAIRNFLGACRKPAIQAEGAALLELKEGCYALTLRPDGVLLEAWNAETNLTRRIRRVRAQRPGRLDLAFERFDKREGVLALIDLEHRTGAGASRIAQRRQFREQFRYFLRRQFPGWRIVELTTEPDLQHTLSPAYPRGLLRRGATGLAAISAPTAQTADGLLAFGLIWLDYLRRREPRLAVEALILHLPQERVTNTCLRLRWLNPEIVRFLVFAHGPGNLEAPVDPRDYGNVNTRLEPYPPTGPFPGATPEASLEASVRKQIQVISPDLLPSPVYGQVPAVVGLDRGIMDLLAATRDGRLAVIELKASQDPQLPIQALDYWLRVNWHAAQGDFSALGFFPGVPLRRDPPRLILVAPALEFHPTTERLLRYLSPSIEVERVGVAIPWENGLRVLFRACGAQAPATGFA
jgi:hypothetical protein